MASERLRLAPTRSGPQTVEVDGVRYHSAYNPLREVERFYGSVNLEEADVVLHFGWGLGYAADVLGQRVRSDARVIVFEPDEELFEVEAPDRTMFEDPRFRFVVGEQVSRFFRLLDVLEHVQDPVKTVSEVYRVLKPGGTLIMRSPSFKMLDAHHLDNAITWPGIHYLLSMKTWAAGLNHLLFDERYNDTLNYSPYYKTIRTRYHKCVTANLNGLDYSDFVEIFDGHDFEVQTMGMTKRHVGERKGRLLKYYLNEVTYRIPIVKEYVSRFVLFIGKKPTK